MEPGKDVIEDLSITAAVKMSDAVAVCAGVPYAVVKNIIAFVDPRQPGTVPVISGTCEGEQPNSKTFKGTSNLSKETIMVPLGFLSSNLEAEIVWESDGTSLKVSLSEKSVVLAPGKEVLVSGGKEVSLTSPMQKKNDCWMVPLKEIAEALGKRVFCGENGIFVILNGGSYFDPFCQSREIAEVTALFKDHIDNVSNLDNLDSLNNFSDFDGAEEGEKSPVSRLSNLEKEAVLEKAEGLYQAFSEDHWSSLAPTQAPRMRGNEPPDGSGRWIWNPAYPDNIRTFGGLSFTDSRYPLEKKQIKVMSGKQVEVPHIRYQDKPVMVQARIDFEKMLFLQKNLPALSLAYRITGDEKYARRIGVVLDKWAKAVPDYFMTERSSPNLIDADHIAEYYNTEIQRASDHNGIAHEFSLEILGAFETIFHSKALQLLSRECGYDVKEHILKDFFVNIAEWLVQYQSMKVHTSARFTFSSEGIARTAVLAKRGNLLQWVETYLAEKIKG